MPCKCTILRGTQQPGFGDKCLSFNSASRRGGHSQLLPAVPIGGQQLQSPDRGSFGLASFPLISTHKQYCPVPRFAPPRPVSVCHTLCHAPSRCGGKAGAELGRGTAGSVLGMLGWAGRAGLRAASRKPSPSGGCGRERGERVMGRGAGRTFRGDSCHACLSRTHN